jgi:polyisoprenoid-binding protein YceI
VREQLAGLDFPNDAVGSTRALSGTLVLGADGSVVADESAFRVALATLVTDNDRRDNYVRNRTLEVELHPEAVFTPRRLVGLPTPLPASGSVTFRLEGELALHGVTRPVVWEVQADISPGQIKGLATTAFPFERFEISIPKVARVLSVDNNIRLELDFRLVPQGG